ncbi:MAG: hypothetical protein SOU95_01420, partial [Candidatus Cryptobacteroides sp.]|nr:hypothetical protein [Bacteroidales bacterium]MDD7133849.1 hypothetical protein [Bacteroidales bacterium]MDY2773165.1 hypothetical protein [Candidatus Cryptobacteroides sp.]
NTSESCSFVKSISLRFFCICCFSFTNLKKSVDFLFISTQTHFLKQYHLLENVDGHLLVDVDYMPETFQGCYFYNGGKFPFLKKKSLENIILTDGQHSIAGRIVGCTYKPRVRFFFGSNPSEPSREDPNGDSCIWQVTFKLTPIK